MSIFDTNFTEECKKVKQIPAVHKLMEYNDAFTYYGTFEYKGHEVEVAIDDYGQCYVIAYINKDGVLVEESCGTYNTDYVGYIVSTVNYEFGDEENGK